MVESSPGIGKTQIVSQAANELGIAFKAIHAPLLQPEDYGFPVVSATKKDINFIVSSDKFPLEEDSSCPDEGIFLIDELSQADQSAQKILANLIQEREIHGHKIKKGWTIVATGNKQADRAGANRILGHLANRMTRITLEVNTDDWTQWALENGVKTEVVAFIRYRPALLTNYDPKNEVNATPRAWVEGVSARLGHIDESMELAVFGGDVGEGPAAELLAFMRIYRRLPNPDTIVLKPKTAEVPKDVQVIYALVGALVDRSTDANFGRIMQFIKRLPPEFMILYVKDATSKCPDIEATEDYTMWCAKEGAALLS